MKKLLLTLLFSLALTSPAQAYQYNQAHDTELQAVLTDARMKTVMVVSSETERYGYDRFYHIRSISTGTMIGDGLILTNAHVLMGKDTDIKTYTGDSYSATVVKTDTANDLALLKINSDAAGFTLSSTEPYAGMPVMSVGQPYGLPQWSFSEGTLQSTTYAYVCENKPYSGYISNNQNLGGNSGGPLLNESGELIGLIRAKMMDGTDNAVSIPLDVIKTFLKEEK
jgi:serine protease Do